jgi:hypothetical protein
MTIEYSSLEKGSEPPLVPEADAAPPEPEQAPSTAKTFIKNVRVSEQEHTDLRKLMRLACNMGYMGVDHRTCSRQCSGCDIPQFTAWYNFSKKCAEEVLKAALLQSRGLS